jgi:hypothetical protein
VVAETKALQSVSLRGVVVPALAVFVAVAWWASRGDLPQPSESSAGNATSSPVKQTEGPHFAAGNESRNDEVAPALAAVEVGAEASFGAYVDGKYRFLEPSEKLRAALLAREKVAVAINTAKQSNDAAMKEGIPNQVAELAALDQKIGTLLRPGDLAAYEVLKDSDAEQFQLEDYAGGVNAVAPLSDADRKAVLLTKLVHRQRFRQVLADSRLMTGELSTTDRQYAFADASRALGESHDSFLREVRQYLYNDEQYALLSNYENSEYAAELEKLRGIARGE